MSQQRVFSKCQCQGPTRLLPPLQQQLALKLCQDPGGTESHQRLGPTGRNLEMDLAC